MVFLGALAVKFLIAFLVELLLDPAHVLPLGTTCVDLEGLLGSRPCNSPLVKYELWFLGSSNFVHSFQCWERVDDTHKITCCLCDKGFCEPFLAYFVELNLQLSFSVVTYFDQTSLGIVCAGAPTGFLFGRVFGDYFFLFVSPNFALQLVVFCLTLIRFITKCPWIPLMSLLNSLCPCWWDCLSMCLCRLFCAGSCRGNPLIRSAGSLVQVCCLDLCFTSDVLMVYCAFGPLLLFCRLLGRCLWSL